MSKSLNRYISVRVSGKLYAAFQKKALKHGVPSSVLRELVEAFVESRISIQPPTNRKESLYVD